MYNSEKTKIRELKQSIDLYVDKIYMDLDIRELNKLSMIKIGKYLKDTLFQNIMSYWVVTHYDIGYRFLKDEVYRKLVLPDEEKELLLNGIFGWIYYTQSDSIKKEKDDKLLNYVAKYNIKSLKNNSRVISDIFVDLQILAFEPECICECGTMFTQSCREIGTFRFQQMNKLFPELNLELELESYKYKNTYK